MVVRELIELLQEYDPEETVLAIEPGPYDWEVSGDVSVIESEKFSRFWPEGLIIYAKD